MRPATASEEAPGLAGTRGWVGSLVPAVGAGLADLLAAGASPAHAVLLGLLVLGAGLATARIAGRWGLASLAALTAALWSVPYTVPTGHLWLAALPAAVLLAPAEAIDRTPDVVLGAGAGALVGLAGAVLSLGPLWLGLGGLGAFLLVVARPEVPTEETLTGLRTLGLFGPALALLALVGVNAGTGWLEVADGGEALARGLGLVGLLALASLGLLGIGTVLASNDPSQASAWLACSVVVGLLAASLPAGEATVLRAAVASAVVPAAALAAISAGRIRATLWRTPLALAVLPTTALMQIGLL